MALRYCWPYKDITAILLNCSIPPNNIILKHIVFRTADGASTHPG